MPINYFRKLSNPDFWKKPRPFWLGLVVILGLAITVLVIMGSISKITFPERIELKKKPKITPGEIIPAASLLASGKQTYEILTDNPQSLQIIQVDVDPLDAKKGETQTVTVQVKDKENNPITQENKVEAIAYTDNTSVPFSFSLKKAEDLDEATITTWQGSWVCEDTYDLRYTMTIKAENATEEHSIDLSFR